MAERPAVKICGVGHPDDAAAADRLGAAYVGFVLTGGFVRTVALEVAREAAAGLRARAVAVLVDETLGRAAMLAEGLGAAVIQLHGDESPETAAALRDRGWAVWKSVRATGPEDVAAVVERFRGAVDAVLVEGRREGVVGGGGARLDTRHGPAVRAVVPNGLGLVLAGGLTPGNVADAVARFRPDIVDVSSGVEVHQGRKDPELLRRFFDNVGAPAAAPPNPREGGEPST